MTTVNNQLYHVQLPSCLQPWRCDLARLGTDHDGGYLLSMEDVHRTQTLLSLGVGDNWGFETDFYQHTACGIQAYDPAHCDNPARSSFFQGTRQLTQKSIGPNAVTLSQALQNCADKVFLKCDIEGAEYDIIDEIINHRQRWTGIVMEVHGIAHHARLDVVIDLVRRLEMPLVHLHVNNWFYYITDQSLVPDIIELTFSCSADCVLDRKLTLPHQLDQPNCKDRPQFGAAWQ